jgi:uncharacterized protein (TIGR02118 family)
MIKVLSLIKRPADMSFEDFRRWATEEHPEFAKKIPGLVKYVVNVAASDDPANPFDAVNELHFESEDAFKAAFASEAGKAAGGDAAAHASQRVRLVTHEHQLI